MINIPRHIQDLKPYKAGKPIDELMREKGISKVVKLASNENPLGPSPKAVQAIKDHLGDLHRYPSPSSYKVVHVIAEKYNKQPEQIICSDGSDSLIQYLVTAFSSEGDELLSSEGSFIGWYVNVNKLNRSSKLIPLKNYHIDLNKIYESISEKTRIIYLANPNNPTGTIFGKNEFENFLGKVPQNVLIILDEAYTIYSEQNPEYPNGLNYETDNLVILRTLSKSFGLAGLRIGFAIGSQRIIREMYKVRLPFEPNILAQEAAIAAFDDTEFLCRTINTNSESLNMMRAKFDELKIRYIPTSANFLLLIFSDEKYAKEFYSQCLDNGLILRYLEPFGINNGIRINSGTIDETLFALDIISDVVTRLKRTYPHNF